MASSSSQFPSSLKGISSVTPSPPSSSLTPVLKEGEYGNWAELPSALTGLIMQRLGTVDLLNAQIVCTSWRGVCKDPALWRKINMHNFEDMDLEIRFRHNIMCRHAVDRSQGGLVEINIWSFATDPLLSYIADRSSRLTSFKLVICGQITSEGLTKALVKLPMLEELEVSYCSFSADSLLAVGRACPNLKTLKLNRVKCRYHVIGNEMDAVAIASTMPGLRHLQLLGNRLTDDGLNAILDKCPNLEHLDLRHCIFLNLLGDLEKRCERIKVFIRPNDSTHDESMITLMDKMTTMSVEL